MNTKIFIWILIFFILTSNHASAIKETIEFYKGYALIRGISHPSITKGHQPNLKESWELRLNETVSGLAYIDFDSDQFDELVVGLADNRLYLINSNGEPEKHWNVTGKTPYGRIYDISVGDYDYDFDDEILIAIGGERSTREYQKNQIIPDSDKLTIEHSEKVLWKVSRNLGSIIAFNKDGKTELRKDLLESVQTVDVLRMPEGKRYIVAGIGELTTYTYNEKTEVENMERVWEELEEVWSVESDCIRFCGGAMGDRRYGSFLYYCGFTPVIWDGDEIEQMPNCCCKKRIEGDIGIQWIDVDYEAKEGTVSIFSPTGDEQVSLKFTNETGSGDFNVKSIVIDDVDDDGYSDILTGLDNGELTLINLSDMKNLTETWSQQIGPNIRTLDVYNSGSDDGSLILIGETDFIHLVDDKLNTLWKSKLDGVVVNAVFNDVEDDGLTDIVATGRNGELYVFDLEGKLRWKFDLDQHVYDMIITDLDRDGFKEFAFPILDGLKSYELSEYYVKSHRANTNYEQALDFFEQNEFTQARIRVERAKTLYEQVENTDEIQKCNFLIGRINNELQLNKKREADLDYDKAMSYYALNQFNESIRHLEKAKILYQELLNDEGVKKSENMISQIEREIVLARKLEGDSYYTKAITFKNFGNITKSLEFNEQAREIYEEIGFYNGTIKTTILIRQIADSEFQRAKTFLSLKNFDKAENSANLAFTLYEQVGNFNMSTQTKTLIDDISNARIIPEKPPHEGTPSYLPYVIGFIAVIGILMVFNKMKKKKYVGEGYYPSKIEDEIEGLNDEIEDI